MVRDSNTPLSAMDRTGLKINSEREDMNNTVNHLDLTHIYRTLKDRTQFLKCTRNVLQDSIYIK